LIGAFSSATVFAQEKPATSAEELAKKLATPIASRISVPFKIILIMVLGQTMAQEIH